MQDKREPMNVHPIARRDARRLLSQTTTYPELRGVGYSALVLVAASRARTEKKFRAELVAAQEQVSSWDAEDRHIQRQAAAAAERAAKRSWS